MSGSIKIYEFSTGIYVEEFEHGSWLSQGFTGDWMHISADFQGIPLPIRQAIADKLFAISESDRSTLVVVGRVVKYREDEQWSVLTIITRAVDNFGRSLPVYRYFYCSGQDGMINILNSIENYRQQHQKLPIFNPLNPTEKLSDYSVKLSQNIENITLKEEAVINFNGSQIPSIILSNSYSLKELHNFTVKKSNNIYPIAWANNVQALARPESFLVIQTANQEAYNYFNSLAKGEGNPLITAVDEQRMKEIIKNLINSEQITEIYDQKFCQYWMDSAVNNPQFLKSIFNQLGMGSVLTGNIHLELLKIFEIGSFLISDEITLLEYFQWQRQYYQRNGIKLLDKFRQKVRPYLNNLITFDLSINKRFINNILKLLLQEKLTVKESFMILTNEQESLWANRFFFDKFYDSIDNLVKNIDNQIQGKPLEQSWILEEQIYNPLFIYIKNLDLPPSHKRKLKKPEYYRIINDKHTYKYVDNLLIRWYWSKIAETWDDIQEELYQIQHILNSKKYIPKPCTYYQPLAKLLKMLAKYDQKFTKLYEYFFYVVGSVRVPIHYNNLKF